MKHQPKIKNFKKLFNDISYVDPRTLQKKPMEVLEPIVYYCSSSDIKKWEYQLDCLTKLLENFNKKAINSIRKCIDKKTLDPDDELIKKLYELENIAYDFYDIYLKIVKLNEVPLFVRLDSTTLQPEEGHYLPRSVEFQYRIGGLGFHQAVNDIFGTGIIDNEHMIKRYSEVVKSFWMSLWGSSPPFVQLLVPRFKSAEEVYWSKRMSEYGVRSQVVYIDDVNKALNQIIDLYKQGARLIFRREMHLPALLNHRLGKEIIDLVLNREIRFDPPLSLFYDGKATSVIVSDNKKSCDLGAYTKAIFNEDELKDYVFEKRRGVIKLGSGFDIYSSFGGRAVTFLKDLTRKQRENFYNMTLSKIKLDNFWYAWQPEIWEKVKVVSAETNKEMIGRIRHMVFTSLYNKKILGLGANVYDKSKIVRGGHPIASIECVMK